MTYQLKVFNNFTVKQTTSENTLNKQLKNDLTNKSLEYIINYCRQNNFNCFVKGGIRQSSRWYVFNRTLNNVNNDYNIYLNKINNNQPVYPKKENQDKYTTYFIF